ncbi:MAG: hypothetical protein JW954_06740 [Dehalococcoidaceae bacterium]|nr:hypothetical protein [Dehalococcoidaceae bacterium]
MIENGKLFSRILVASFLIVAAVFISSPQLEAGTTEAQGEFMVSLEVAPQEIYQGDTFTIIVNLTNTAGVDGIYEAKLKINDTQEAEKSLRVDPRGTGSIEFQLSKETPGEYSIDVNGLKGSFTVLEGVNPDKLSNNSTVVWIAVAVAVVAAGVILFLLLRKKNTNGS